MMTAKPDKTGPRNSSLVSGKLKSRPANPLPFGLGVLCCLIVGLRVKMCVWLGVSRGLDLAFLNAD